MVICPTGQQTWSVSKCSRFSAKDARRSSEGRPAAAIYQQDRDATPSHQSSLEEGQLLSAADSNGGSGQQEAIHSSWESGAEEQGGNPPPSILPFHLTVS